MTYWTAKAAENISTYAGGKIGPQPVALNHSGEIIVAMAGNNNRMPAVGVVFDNIESGGEVKVYYQKTFPTPFLTSGQIGQEVVCVGERGGMVLKSQLDYRLTKQQVAITNSGLANNASLVLEVPMGTSADRISRLEKEVSELRQQVSQLSMHIDHRVWPHLPICS